MTFPQLIKPIKSFAVKQGAIIHVDLGHHFAKSHDMEFSLINTKPKWLMISKNTGVILGIAPKVARTTQYLITIRASNQAGVIDENFIIKVVSGNFISSITKAALNFTLNKRKYELISKHPRTHDVLRYLYEYYRASKEWKILRGLMREEASHMNIKVSNKIDYYDFKKVVESKKPMIEHHLRKKIKETDLHLLVEMEMQNEEMRNFFRQGSQPQGAHGREVWNYLSAPSLHNWTHVETVLRLAVAAILAQYRAARKHELSQHRFHTPQYTTMPQHKDEE